ncbi:LLM class flavin-dependent oxidoreductase [Amnibacterium kyonggiense]|nr:LLM class flavin-dependent oxidoreductase [Amnibacterium kyonggiense]
MVDYGHPLRFGSFITPSATAPQRVVDLAVRSEEVGLDLVTFQDHPYQPAFLDTWTLLSWVAARTERIHLSGNVLNLPLRIPSVLASSAASLDLLSGGRVELGLGAGGFWDAIAAMGVPKLTPGESVSALSEAIDVIRGRWDAADRSVLRAGGDLHRVDGAKRGPAPAHAIPIWVGARGPRMLRLIGTKGDGWLPSLPWLQPGDLARGQAIIDGAAQAAGRDPREVVRLLNIDADTGADELVALALEDGISTFILPTDDTAALERFATEVVPAVREQVGAVRAERGTTAGRARGAVALAKRRPGIEYDGLPAALAETAVEPGDQGYARYTSSYLRGGAPGLILRPRTVEEVQEAVRFAGRHRHLPLGIFSAGHGLSGRSLNRDGLVVDVGTLRSIEVLDAAAGLVRIEPGALWVEVAEALEPLGLAITSGDYGGVGVGGLATAGGVGWFAREHGLTIDRIRAVEVVLADGSFVRATATEHPDLFWAMRGAGANFGVAVAFEFEAARVGTIAFAQLAFDVADTAAFLEGWGAAMEAADRSVTGEIIIGRGGRSAQAMLVVDHDDPDTVLEGLQPFAAIAPLVDSSVALTSYAGLMRAMVSDAPQQGRGEPRSHSGNVPHLTPAVSRALAALIDSGSSYFFSLRALGGAVADVPAAATAFAGRDANFTVAAFGSPDTEFDARWRELLPVLDGMYLSFESDTGPEVVARAFPPAHLARLRALKATYDPAALFRDNFFIAPEEREESAVA